MQTKQMEIIWESWDVKLVDKNRKFLKEEVNEIETNIKNRNIKRLIYRRKWI
jgi:hypothetical protein